MAAACTIPGKSNNSFLQAAIIVFSAVSLPFMDKADRIEQAAVLASPVDKRFEIRIRCLITCYARSLNPTSFVWEATL